MLPNLILLTAFQLAGELIVSQLSLRFPGPLCGMTLLLVWLWLNKGPSEGLHAVSQTFVQHLGLLFVPAGTAIVLFGDLLAEDGVAIAVALVVSTAATILVAGLIGNRFAVPRRQLVRAEEAG